MLKDPEALVKLNRGTYFDPTTPEFGSLKAAINAYTPEPAVLDPLAAQKTKARDEFMSELKKKAPTLRTKIDALFTP